MSGTKHRPPGQRTNRGLHDSLKALQNLLDDMIAEYTIDPGQIYVMGFSQGAAMTSSLLLTVPHRIAGALILSGYVPLDAQLDIDPAGINGKQVFIAHGTQDTTIHVSLGRATREYLQNAGANITYHEYSIGHGINSRELDDVIAWLAAQQGI